MRFYTLISLVFLSLTSAVIAGRAPAHPERMRVFCETYDACRAGFLSSVQKSGVKAETGRWQVPSKIDQNLFIDYAYFPPTGEPRGLLILSSGVHGVEGFAGSAMQQLFLQDTLPTLDRKSLGILVIHTINPYGVKYQRRVSENNVDLNRNFDVNRELFGLKNEQYAKLNGLLNPTKPASRSLCSRAGFYYSVGKSLLKESTKVLRQAILGGQYQYERGLYYGGRDFEPQQGFLEAEIRKVAAPFAKVLVLDLHTGYGSNGVLHLLPSGYETQPMLDAGKKIFAGDTIEDVKGDEFYGNHGDFSYFVANTLQRDGKFAVPMVLEYGTVNNQTTLGGMESLRRMILENQLHWYGATKASTAESIRSQFLDMYFPKSKKWRQTVIDVSATKLPAYVRNFQAGLSQ